MNNLTKGLGKYQGRLRWKFYSKNIQSVITAHRSALTDLLVLKPVSDQSTVAHKCHHKQLMCKCK